MPNQPVPPRMIKGGFIVLDSETGAVLSILALPFNPATLTRTLEPTTPITPGPTVETAPAEPREVIRCSFVLDVSSHASEGEIGIDPELSTLELLMYTMG